MKSNPILSVVMTTYNRELYIEQALSSILNQTFSDFELIVVNDCSTDSTPSILSAITDERVIVLTNEKNMGISASANRGVRKSKGKYIARMDDDDICVPQRFEWQVKFLETHPDIGVCGGWLSIFGDAPGMWKTHEKDEQIRADLFYNMPMANPTLMIRRELFIDNDIWYNEEYGHCRAEDYDFLLRVSSKTKLHNLQKVLLEYRKMNKLEVQKDHDERKRVLDIIRSGILRQLHLEPDQFLEIHERISKFNLVGINMSQLKKYISLVLEKNLETNVWPHRLLRVKLMKTWIKSYIKNLPASLKHQPILWH